ncbi:MAG: chemotaxis protein CheB [Bacteroidia bacterium]|nr:MAG: chemotaxis protein CheB [Bacteroidia bacterium]
MIEKGSRIVIGGSAGSFNVVLNILSNLPKDYPFPVILVLHRLKHIKNSFVDAISLKTLLPVCEPYDKQSVTPGQIYIAPANYHLYIEPDQTFALSVEDPVNYSRPAIDITFSSAGCVWQEKCVAVLLSGANADGALGLKTVKSCGGTILVQSPQEAIVNVMPTAGIKEAKPEKIFTTPQIIDYLLQGAKPRDSINKKWK